MARFGFLWAFALLYHQVFYRAAFSSPLDSALTLAAAAAMLFPGSVAALGMLAALHLLVVAQDLPLVYNHWYFASLVSLGLLAAAIVGWRHPRRPETPPAYGALSAAFKPAGRVCLLLLYFLSGFHKLNHDFLSPGVSCGSVMSEALASRLGLPGGLLLGIAAIGFTLAVELGAPVLLVVARTRSAGVIVALLFHVVMAAAGYGRFSATGVALLTLFLPRDTPAWFLGARTRVLVTAALLLGTIAGPPVANPLFLAAQLLSTGVVLLLAARAWSPRTTVPAGLRPPDWALGWVPMVAPAVVLISGLTPYLGLGTDRAMAMYSNLRTEGGRTNHLLVPAGAQVFGFQRDMVLILESSVPRLGQHAERGTVLPYQELRAILTEEIKASRPNPSVTFMRGGERRVVGDAARDTTLELPVSWLAQKLLRFRAVEADGRRECGV